MARPKNAATTAVSATAQEGVPTLKQMMESQNHQIGLIDTVVYELEREFGTTRAEVASAGKTPETLVEQALVHGARLHNIWDRLLAVRNAVSD